MADPQSTGIFRVELAYDEGPALWGTVYASADEAKPHLKTAKAEHPDATGARVVELWTIRWDKDGNPTGSEWRAV